METGMSLASRRLDSVQPRDRIQHSLLVWANSPRERPWHSQAFDARLYSNSHGRETVEASITTNTIVVPHIPNKGLVGEKAYWS